MSECEYIHQIIYDQIWKWCWRIKVRDPGAILISNGIVCNEISRSICSIHFTAWKLDSEPGSQHGRFKIGKFSASESYLQVDYSFWERNEAKTNWIATFYFLTFLHCAFSNYHIFTTPQMFAMRPPIDPHLLCLDLELYLNCIWIVFELYLNCIWIVFEFVFLFEATNWPATSISWSQIEPKFKMCCTSSLNNLANMHFSFILYFISATFGLSPLGFTFPLSFLNNLAFVLSFIRACFFFLIFLSFFLFNFQFGKNAPSSPLFFTSFPHTFFNFVFLF